MAAKASPRYSNPFRRQPNLAAALDSDRHAWSCSRGLCTGSRPGGSCQGAGGGARFIDSRIWGEAGCWPGPSPAAAGGGAAAGCGGGGGGSDGGGAAAETPLEGRAALSAPIHNPSLPPTAARHSTQTIMLLHRSRTLRPGVLSTSSRTSTGRERLLPFGVERLVAAGAGAPADVLVVAAAAAWLGAPATSGSCSPSSPDRS